jgi:hypothetical protein
MQTQKGALGSLAGAYWRPRGDSNPHVQYVYLIEARPIVDIFVIPERCCLGYRSTLMAVAG